MDYIHRQIEDRILKAMGQFPALLITGARQSGKSTLLKTLFPQLTYLSLDDPALRDLAVRDPRLFLTSYPEPMIIDEIQYAPELLNHIKMAVDRDRGKYGRYLLTGSQVFPLMAGVSETLAGRIAVFHLYPLSFWELNRFSPISPPNEVELADYILKGFYPEHYSNSALDRRLWFSSYISTYVERDVRSIRHVSDLGTFQRFVMLLAARVGALLNLSEISRECGITLPTAKSWLSLLESTYIVYVLRPHAANLTKRLVKSPKLYFVDTGLLCGLLGIDSREQLLRIGEIGRIFENLVIMEKIKRSMAESGSAPFFFYRTAAGVEIDLIVKRPERLLAVEIKWAKTVNYRMGAGLRNFDKTFPGSECVLACLQPEPMPLGDGVWSRHWWDMLG